MLRRLLPATLTAALALSAVAAAPPERPAPPRATPGHAVDSPGEFNGGKERSRVVVAAIDSGINPYHDAFQVDEPAVDRHVLEAFGIDRDHVLRITDDYQDDAAGGLYDDVEEGELYWFAGTNILVWSDDFGSRPFLPDNDRDAHGTGVTGAVVAANPDAIVLFVEGITADAETYAFTHSEVDIVTTSYGFVTSAPLGALEDSYTGVVDQGKLHFGASANDPTLSPTDGTSGPWWAIGIAGFGEGEDGGGGKESLSGTAPDFVGDFRQDLPYCAFCTEETRSVRGTSFATPRSAGTASAVLLRARIEAGHLGGVTEDGLMVDAGGTQVSNWELRRALEEGAAVPDEAFPVGPTEQPVNQDAPYLQVGWGLLSPEPGSQVIDRTLEALAGGTTFRQFKDEATCDYMTDYMTFRYAIWDANPLSDSFGQTNALEGGSPYIAC